MSDSSAEPHVNSSEKMTCERFRIIQQNYHRVRAFENAIKYFGDIRLWDGFLGRNDSYDAPIESIPQELKQQLASVVTNFYADKLKQAEQEFANS